MMRHIFLVPTLLLAAMPAWAGTIDDIVAGVSQSQYTTYLGSLFTGTGQSRDLDGAEHDLARDYIFSNFTSLGLTASLDPFSYGGGTYQNVVGVRTGTVRPEEIYIVGAHYDSRGPGADDNASGVAGVLEAARVLSGYSFASTLVFVAFDREEQGLIGSYHYAQAASATGQNIRGMLSLDMIAYNPAGATYNTAYVMSGPDSVALGGDIAAAVTAYSGGLTPVYGSIAGGSDQWPFDVNGYQGAVLIERNYAANPNYHQSTDSVDTAGYIDYAYATGMTRSAVGWLADSGEPVPEPQLWAAVALMVIWMVWRRRRRMEEHFGTS